MELGLTIEQIRAETPLFREYIYLDAAAACPPPLPVVEEVTGYLEKLARLGPYLPSFRAATYEKVEEVRGKVARLIGAEPEEIAFTQNGTEGINLVASGLEWRPGDEVVLLDVEFHSNFVPWLRLEKERGVRLRVLETGPGGLTTPEEILAAVGEKTRLVSMTHVPNALGTLQPAEAIGKALKERYPGVLYLLNASQSLGLLPVDVNHYHCDFLAAPGRKWLRGPEGSGLLYVRREHLEKLRPAFTGWGGTEWLVAERSFRYAASARRFQAGLPNIPAILGLGAAVDYVAKVGIAGIGERVKRLTETMFHLLGEIPGVELYGPGRPGNRIGMIPFTLAGVEPKQLVRELEERGVIIEAGSFMANVALAKYGRTEVIRISPHYYNTEEDLTVTAEHIRSIGERSRP